MRKSLVALSVLAATALPSVVNAADYSDDIHKNDYKWMNFNLMYALDEYPRTDSSHSGHDYLEMEFGGRSGVIDLYGYVDVFNLTNSDSQDKSGSDDKIFMKFAPRFSLDGMTGKDLSFGPVQELYIATLMNWGGDNGGVNNYFIGLGSDVNVPWLGKIGLNLYGLYDMNKKDWNGYQISTNWFKPFYTFANGTFLSYQGYIDYQFGMKKKYASASNGGAMFNGLYWHSERFAVGYGLKAYYNVYGIKDGIVFPGATEGLNSTGFGHYFDITYKF
ncbi:nucleoside-specific channel-forming Tsx family protein [Photobacterium damselae]|uniref:nucleoside-specific channel-forming Tsx family protein n=1 Tax=Photobacterium damselae TaxID=38293 RepID=UPI0018A5C708|nr:outer membrane protein OmpK [Photobacterium damselae]QOQ68036.1 outer membrane protein OmpK [Photobacterium damselae subsp. damselae]